MTTNEELRRLAEAATPDASTKSWEDAQFRIVCTPDKVLALLDELEHHPYSDYIAARQAAEETIRELRERITVLEAERDRYRGAIHLLERWIEERVQHLEREPYPANLHDYIRANIAATSGFRAVIRQALSSLSQESVT